MDERYDMMRSVTDGRWLYIRNFRPDQRFLLSRACTPPNTCRADLSPDRTRQPINSCSALEIEWTNGMT
jgi:hypothetical protein